MKKEDKKNTFIEGAKNIAIIGIVFIVLSMYWDAWKKSFQERNWLAFILISLIPALASYYLIWQMLFNELPPGGRNPYF